LACVYNPFSIWSWGVVTSRIEQYLKTGRDPKKETKTAKEMPRTTKAIWLTMPIASGLEEQTFRNVRPFHVEACQFTVYLRGVVNTEVKDRDQQWNEVGIISNRSVLASMYKTARRT
jgi:hypothetical protein